MSERLDKAAGALERSQRLGEEWSKAEEARFLAIANIQAAIALGEAVEALVDLLRPAVQRFRVESERGGW